MNDSSSNDKNRKSPPAGHDDAWSGWGAILGAGAGALIGLFFRHALAGALGGSVIGWLAGAFVDRSRR